MSRELRAPRRNTSGFRYTFSGNLNIDIAETRLTRLLLHPAR